jgi:adenosine deaminase
MSAYRLDGVDIAALPKVSLHDHLDGALRPSTIIDLASAAGIELPAANPRGLARWFVEQSSRGDLPSYLETFDLTVALLQDAVSLRRVAGEYVQDVAADGIVYAEVRWAPELCTRAGLTLREAVDAVADGLEDGTRRVHAAGGSIQATQILCAMRQNDRADEVAALAVDLIGDGVAGFDIAGPETGYPPARLATAFNALAAAFVPVTVHAGEAAGLGSIASAIVDGRALRLGHGTRLIDDIEVDDDGYATLGPVAQWVLDRGIGIEACPTSNLQTGAIPRPAAELADHPLDLFYQLGMNVSVHVDNRLQSGTTLTRELALVADTFGYGIDDLETLTLNAVDTAFLPAEQRQQLTESVQAGYAEVCGG